MGHLIDTLGCGQAADAGDHETIITTMRDQPGVFSQEIAKSIVGRSDRAWLRTIGRTRRPFRGNGDAVDSQIVLNYTRPKENQVLNWQTIRQASSGYNPCCVQYQEFTYGSRKVSTCLYQDGWKSPRFCKTDIAFKWRPEDQMGQVMDIMANWSGDIWHHWTRTAYVRVVQTFIVSSTWNYPRAFGGYQSPGMGARPTSAVTHDTLELIWYNHINPANGPASRTVDGFELLFCSNTAFEFLIDKYAQKRAESFGFRSPTAEQPSLIVPGIGEVRRIGTTRYLCHIIEARRYREPAAGETWEDAIIPCTVTVADETGDRDTKNPDYYDPNVALYEEWLWFNDEAAIWKVPPDALRMANGWFPATEFMGNFIPVRVPEELDPFQKQLFFAAEFAAGMVSLYPERGAALLALCPHATATDVDVQCTNTGQATVTRYYVKGCCLTLIAGQLLIQTEEAVPAACPAGTGLYLVTQNGGRQFVTRGTEVVKDGKYYYNIDFPAADAANAVCRDCDPWSHFECTALTNQTNTTCEDCGGTSTASSTGGYAGLDTTKCEAVFAGETVEAFYQDKDAGATSSGPWATAAAAEAAIQAWVDTQGGGTVVVTYSGGPEHIWRVTVEYPDAGPIDLSDAKIVYDTDEDALFACCDLPAPA